MNGVVKKARAKAATGPSGLTYKVYKKSTTVSINFTAKCGGKDVLFTAVKANFSVPAGEPLH
jgi:nitrogen fixation protein FixH